MSDDDDAAWPFGAFGGPFQEAGEQALDRQRELMQALFSAGTGGGALSGGLSGFDQLGALSRSTATFKTRVQSGGRISIPDAEREALDIDEGDIVQTIVIPITKGDSNE